MKTYLYLIKKYVKSYPKRYLGMVLCISLFLFAFLTILWYDDSYQYSLIENDKIKNGSYESICFFANKETVLKNESTLLDEQAGIMQGLWKTKDSDDIWIGSIDENIIELLSLKFLSGRMPENENEAVLEKSTYDMLGLNSNIGDTVNFTIEKADGSFEQKSFILTGIINNFTSKIESLYEFESGNPPNPPFPSVFTVRNKDELPEYVHVFAKKTSSLSRNLNNKYWYSNTAVRNETALKAKSSKILLVPMELFFILTTVTGLLSVSAYFFKEYERYLNSLRCIGFSKKKIRKLLFIQGFLLWICSLIISCAMSTTVLLAIKLISSFSSQKLFLNLSPTTLAAAGLLEGTVIFISFSILQKRFYKTSPLKDTIYLPKKQRKSQTDIKRCWHKAYGNKYRLQNLTCKMIIFFCVGMAIFGSFLPLFNARGTTFQNPDDFSDDTDYSLYMKGGSSYEESYYINFPIGCGISRNALEKITKDKRVEITEASISNLCIPFFLTDQNPKNRLLYKYVVEVQNSEYNYLFENSRKDEMIKLAGGKTDTNSLVELPVKWQSYETTVKNIKEFTDGVLNEEKYKRGEEIAAPDSLCNVGDEFTMIVPVPDKNANEENIQEHIRFEVTDVKVAATYPVDERSSSELIISSEYVFSIYPDLNYEMILIKNLAPEDSVWTEELENNLEYIKDVSTGITFDNYEEMSKEFYDRVRLETLQIIISVIIYITIILIAITLSSYVQIRSNLKSYAMMRAIGASIETVQKLILRETTHTAAVGIAFGAICGWGINIFFALIESHVKSWDIFLFYVTPVFILTVLFLYFGNRIAVKWAVRSLITNDIIENLNRTE